MNNLLRHSKLFVKRNASIILTVMGGAGVIATSVMAVKATPKALHALDIAKEEKGEELTKFEVVKAAGPVYIPSVVTGVATIACIFGANALNKRQQVAMMSAYALLDNSYKEYKKKVAEIHGEEGANHIREEIAKDKLKESDIQLPSDKQLFFDEYLGRYFEATLPQVLKAEERVNRDLSMQSYATLAEFYDNLGIEYDDAGLLGWSADRNQMDYWQTWVDFDHHKMTMDDGLECTIISMRQEPYPDWDE